jgi:hypothetical protein
MAAATKVTNKGVAMAADRLRTTPATYTTAPKFVGVGTAGTTAAVTDTALGTEVETRATGTESIVTTTATGDTMQIVGTVTATATRAITECGTFDASTDREHGHQRDDLDGEPADRRQHPAHLQVAVHDVVGGRMRSLLALLFAVLTVAASPAVAHAGVLVGLNAVQPAADSDSRGQAEAFTVTATGTGTFARRVSADR